MRLCRPFCGDREFPVVAAVPPDRRVDGPAGRIRMSLHQRVIALVDRALLERPLEHGVGALGERHHHHPGGADVEAMHDALPLVHAGGGDPVTGSGQAAEHRRPGPAHRRVRGHRRPACRPRRCRRRSTGSSCPRCRRACSPAAPARSGSRTCSHAPAVRRSDFPACTPSSSTPPSSASAAAALRDSPSSRASPASTRMPARPSGTGIERSVISCSVAPSAGLIRLSARAAVRAPAYGVEVEAEDRQHDQQDRAADHRRVGDVEHRPPADRQEVHDMSAQRPGRPEEAIDQVAHGAAEDHPEARPPTRATPAAGPSRRCRPPHRVAISVSIQVYPVAIENAAPELRTKVQVTVSPMIDTGWPGGSSLTASTLVTMSRVSTTAATDSSRRSRRGGLLRAACCGVLGVPSLVGRGHRLGRSCWFLRHSPIIP